MSSKKDQTNEGASVPLNNPKKHLFARKNEAQFEKKIPDDEYYKNWEDDRI